MEVKRVLLLLVLVGVVLMFLTVSSLFYFNFLFKTTGHTIVYQEDEELYPNSHEFNESAKNQTNRSIDKGSYKK